MHVCICVYVCVCMCACRYVCVHVCMYVCVCTKTVRVSTEMNCASLLDIPTAIEEQSIEIGARRFVTQQLAQRLYRWLRVRARVRARV